jgi:hypothetical protein
MLSTNPGTHPLVKVPFFPKLILVSSDFIHVAFILIYRVVVVCHHHNILTAGLLGCTPAENPAFHHVLEGIECFNIAQ